MQKLLCPSILNLRSIEHLKEIVIELDEAGADIFHIDIMDGHFVPNFGLSLLDFGLVRENTGKPVDVHLMVTDPGRYVPLFAERGADIIYIHPEADVHPAATLAKIRVLGKKAGIAINPGTSVEMVKELFPLCDYVMAMAVNPGITGQPYLDYVEPKILELAECGARLGFQLVIDGGVTDEVAKRLSQAGVEGFVLGSLVLFYQDLAYKTILERIRGY